MSTKLEINFSSSALASSACKLKLKRVVVDGYREKILPASMVYGIACHKYIQVAYDTEGNFKLAQTETLRVFDLPKDVPKGKDYLNDKKHLLTTCMGLWMNFVENDNDFSIIRLDDNKPAVERTFRIKFYEDDFCIIYLCGTIDKVGKITGGLYSIGDWKFTSSWNTDEYFRQYEMSRALRVYTLACKIMARVEPESTLGQVGATKMGAFIDATFLNPDANKNVTLRGKVQQFKDWELDEIEQELRAFCFLFSMSLQNGSVEKREGIFNGSCQNQYEKKCQFWNVCQHHNTPVSEVLLKRDFAVRQFNPLDYNDINKE